MALSCLEQVCTSNGLVVMYAYHNSHNNNTHNIYRPLYICVSSLYTDTSLHTSLHTDLSLHTRQYTHYSMYNGVCNVTYISTGVDTYASFVGNATSCAEHILVVGDCK